MLKRFVQPAALLLSATALAVSSSSGAIKRGFFDHALCCGPQPVMDAEAFPAAGKFAPAAFALPIAASTVANVAAAPASTASSGAAAAPSAAPESQAGGSPEVVDGYLKLGFDRLSSFTFNPAPYDPTKPNEPPPSSADQIPDSIKAYSGKKAVVSGFMLPVKTEKGRVTEFLLMRDAMMCCYGIIPNINEWIIVKMNNGVNSIQDVPLSVYGKLQVQEVFEGGYLSGIYLLEGEKMVTSKP